MGPYAFLAVGVGAATGAWLRWLLSVLLNPLLPALPLGTLAANLVGGYLMGLVLGMATVFQGFSPEIKLLITTGFLGGLTTFSTFSAESVSLLMRQQYGWAAAMVVTHVTGSLGMTALGVLTIHLTRGTS